MRKQKLEADVIEKLKGVLPGEWEAVRATDHERYDILFKRSCPPGLVALEFISTVRIKDLLGRMALEIVERNRTSPEVSPAVLMIAAPRFGERAMATVEQFLLENAPDIEWGLVDGQGTLRLQAPSLGLDLAEFAVPVRGESTSRHSRQLFSDLNRWMLKILLLREMPETVWGGPRAKPYTPTELHRIAGVSVETAHRFVRTAEELDFIRRTRQGLKLVRVEAMLDAWMAAERLSPPRRIPVQWFLSEGGILELAFPIVGNTSVAVGGFEACRRHNVLHTDPTKLEIHVDRNWTMGIEDWEVEACRAEEADLFLLESSYPRSLFGGSVGHHDLWTVDILQAALDVVHSATRGMEQAQFVVDHILSCLARDAR